MISAAGTIGKTVIYDGEPAYFQDSNIVWIDNDETNVLNAYLHGVFQYIDWHSSKGATIERLYNDDIRKIKIPLPPLEEQRRIAHNLAGYEERIAEAREIMETCASKKKTILAAYLS